MYNHHITTSVYNLHNGEEVRTLARIHIHARLCDIIEFVSREYNVLPIKVIGLIGDISDRLKDEILQRQT